MDNHEIDEELITKALQSDAGAVAKERLADRRKGTVKRVLSSVVLTITLLIVALLAGAGMIAYSLWDERVYGDEILYGTCVVSLDGNIIEGKRQFIRPFMDVAGMRFINPVNMSEILIIDNDHFGLVIVSMVEATGESHVSILEPELGPYVEIPLGDQYLFLFEKSSEIISHDNLCN